MIIPAVIIIKFAKTSFLAERKAAFIKLFLFPKLHKNNCAGNICK